MEVVTHWYDFTTLSKFICFIIITITIIFITIFFCVVSIKKVKTPRTQNRPILTNLNKAIGHVLFLLAT